MIKKALRRIYKDKLRLLMRRLSEEYNIFGPKLVEGRIIFDRIDDVSEIINEYHTRPVLPVKKLFLPQRETLFEYEIVDNDVIISDKLDLVAKEKRCIFGVRACDIASLQILRRFFSRGPGDPYVIGRLSNSIIIGIMCNSVFPSCFCHFTGSGPLPKDGFDLFLVDVDDYFIAIIGSERGNRIASKNEDIFLDANKDDVLAIDNKVKEIVSLMKSPPVVDQMVLYDAFVRSFNLDFWEDYAKKCLSCGKCNFNCPTCYCFDIFDEVDLDLRKGRRVRVWDSCHFLSFTRVASGEIFRRNRSSRLKQRVYHKFVYSVNDIGLISCVGCGRCFEVCPASIDLRDIITKVLCG
ncbi:MAG: 4Fe-4S dicluster domain-containing protein [Candidatus Korarchaeota archaeon]|nr:4Fe-4S dicluster domain-containing protein [Thermoproteota archaeon]MCR8501672.1 4Fe-4S dicluster domain-containing protein [Thermoproteota archaeon]